MTQENNKIYSIGHSNQSLESFCATLKKYNINILVDVRTKPYSRWNPQFNTRFLEKHLDLIDIGYTWKGQNLGGLGENIDFDENIKWLANLTKTGQNIVVMCSERDYKKCHRYSLIEPELTKFKIKLAHI